MEKIRKSIAIESAPSKVFDYLTEPAHYLEIWPSMVEVSNPKTSPDGAHSFDWIYKMAGMRFHGHSETVEVERPRFRKVRNASGIPSTFQWTFAPRGSMTDLTLEVDYEIPGALLGKLAAPFLRRLNEREAETLLENLKGRLEVGGAVETR